MKLIESSKTLSTLDGGPIATSQSDSSPITIGKALGNILLSTKSRKLDPIKLLELARKFHTSKFRVELDASDFEAVKEIVRDDPNFSPLVTGQILETFLEAKDSRDCDEKDPIELRKKSAN